MSIASALLAPAAPVSTGPSAAALGAEAVDAGLFSSKVADALNIGVHGAPVERMTPGRLTGAPSPGVVTAQAMIAEADGIGPSQANGPVTPTPGESVDETVELDVQPPVSDESAITLEEAAKDQAVLDQGVASPTTAPHSSTVVSPAPTFAATPPTFQTDETPPANGDLTAPRAQPTGLPIALATDASAPVTATPVGAETTIAANGIASPSDQNAKAPNLAAQAAIQALMSEVGDQAAAHPTMPAARGSGEAVKMEADLAQAASPQPVTATVAAKPPVPATPSDRPMTDVASRSTDVATTTPVAPDSAKTAAATPAAVAEKPASPSPIAQALTAAQIPMAQVQVAATAATPKSTILVAAATDVVAAVAEAQVSTAPEGEEVAPDQPPRLTVADAAKPLPQSASLLVGPYQKTTDQAGEAAVATVKRETGKAAAPVIDKIGLAAEPTSQPTKTTEEAALFVATPTSTMPDAPAATATVDAQARHQVAAPGHDLGLSTLSRATVETTAQLASQIARRLDSRSTRFDMVLTPEDLGRVDVSLEIGKDGQLSARLAFDNPAAAADLKGRADELRRQLQDAGFQVAGDALDFSQRDPSAGGGAFERQQQRNALFAGASRLAAQADTPIVPAPAAWINHSQTPDRVDLKV
ncbi:flagellar hook-length control protein FliK [Brevundimonas vesicularis]|uniref:flagellar hook-length control protein FliK n=1 Tax=Brevundimonas vesicularis TaxID=41276 RepID=UPI0022AC16EE|nr:flagellar hook-length control protein FliK [Brevundimonas vesicularis]